MYDSFQRYLLSKQTVDDRALNKDVIQSLRVHMPPEPVSMIEIGAGIGTMLKRLVEWDILCSGEYVMVDAMEANISYARQWIPQWAAEADLRLERSGPDRFRLWGPHRDIQIHLECADVFDFIQRNQTPADILIAHAFLDLLPMPASLDPVFSLTRGLAWLTLNFDGLSSLEPAVEDKLDATIERLYHATMDARPTGGDSRMGRKLFEQIRSAGAQILSAGASDWVVHSKDGKYPADEEYFLQFIMQFFESALRDCDELDAADFRRWLEKRHQQIEYGELVYIAHQMDFLVRTFPSGSASSR